MVLSLSVPVPPPTCLLGASPSFASLTPNSPTNPLNQRSVRLTRLRRKKLSCNCEPVGGGLSSNSDNDVALVDNDPSSQVRVQNVWEETEFVEVFGIGNRKDAVLDFCLSSASLSSAVRFWDILMKDSVKIQLQKRSLEQDKIPEVIEVPSAVQSCSKTVILVVSVAYGSDDILALDVLKMINSKNGVVVGIVLKPFSFEGRRRKNEVEDLVDKLQKIANFCIVVDTDALLEKDLVTLDEALKTSNNAVLMAINAISLVISEKCTKLLDKNCTSFKEVKVPEIIKILERYKEAKIGFGAGYNIKTSILRAVYDCPFLGFGVKDTNGVTVCVFASSGAIEFGKVHDILHNFRQTTGFKEDIIMSVVHEPSLEPNVIVTTIFKFCCPGVEKSSILSRLAQHFPFIFNILKKRDPQPRSVEEYENPHVSEPMNSQDLYEPMHFNSADGNENDLADYSGELQELLGSNGDKTCSSREFNLSFEQNEDKVLEPESYASTYGLKTEGSPPLERELLSRQNLGPAYWTLEDVDKPGADDNLEISPVLNNISIYNLPVGVKNLDKLNNSSVSSNSKKLMEWTSETKLALSRTIPSVSQDRMTNTGFDTARDFYSDASAVAQGVYSNDSNRKGVLSSRAESMLEAERVSQKKWNPVLEMRYRGGVYRGRVQGGLPEGKGRLCLRDGSIYDGMWRYGKRSGLGTFYFSNGDVYQGSWRDDVMHGKGWIYFHTGDRWFVNFWKGKANGEGRFYSKLGEIFFGHFKDGWRHGDFLCISVDGARSLEVWNEGVLVSSNQLEDAEASDG